MHMPNPNTCKVSAARTKSVGEKHHLTCFIVTLIIFFSEMKLINYNTIEQPDAAKIRLKPCITKFLLSPTDSLSDAHLHHHRAHLDHLHHQWPWAVQSQEKRIFQPLLTCLTNSKNQLLLYIVYKQLVKALISVTTKYCEQTGHWCGLSFSNQNQTTSCSSSAISPVEN